MSKFANTYLFPLLAALGLLPTIAVAACESGRFIYDPVTLEQPQAEPAIQVTYFEARNALPEELDLIRAWPEIVGMAPPTSVEIEQEERLGFWPQYDWNQSSGMYRIQFDEVFILLLDTAHYNSAYRETRPLIFVDMPERSLRPRQYEFAVVPLYLRDGNLFGNSKILDGAQRGDAFPAPDVIVMTDGFEVLTHELSKAAWHLPEELPFWASFISSSGTWVLVNCANE